jgi:WD repeat-containing protein 91
MATASAAFIDELIRDYLHYRNFIGTSRTFDHELSKCSHEQFRADRIIEQLTLYIQQFDIQNLIDYWTSVEQRFLATLVCDSSLLSNRLTNIRMHIYRCFLIHAVQSTRNDKVNEFFDRLIQVLQQQSNEWPIQWFTLPFISNPEDDEFFQVYFSKQWNDLFWISLKNFLAMGIYQ